MLPPDILDFLILHIDGPCPVIRTTNWRLRKIETEAFRRRFINYPKGSTPVTDLTQLGRQAMCRDLAAMAEILLRAKFSPEFMPPPGLALPSVSPDSEQNQPPPAE